MERRDSSSSDDTSSYSSSSSESRESSVSSRDSMPFRLPTALVQRRKQPYHDDATTMFNGDEDNSSHQQYRSRERRRRKCLFRNLCSKCSTVCLVCAVYLWISVTFFGTSTTSDPRRPIRDRTRDRTRKNKSVLDRFRAWNAGVEESQAIRNKKKNVEQLLDGCAPEPWHADHYPTCNDIHAQRLVSHLASGLWRDVWIVANDYENAAVLKMMKEEHDVTIRNWDRHRRDAVVMEQLAGSPFVVDIFGYCGNTVVTERISPSLEELVIEPEDGIATLPQRVLWARDMAKGIAALHDKGIMHADIQAKQFLWDAGSAKVKINDFNRCRFLARPEDNNSTDTAVFDGEFCPVRIPSAPGKQRSPEEYANEYLTEKLDIYSYANILMALWTGHKAWDDYSSGEAKRLIKDGFVPRSPFRTTTNHQEEKLWNLTVVSYARNPVERPSAHELATVLDHILQELSD